MLSRGKDYRPMPPTHSHPQTDKCGEEPTESIPHGRRKKEMYPALPGHSIAGSLLLGILLWVTFSPISTYIAKEGFNYSPTNEVTLTPGTELLIFLLATIVSLGIYIGSREWSIDFAAYKMANRLLTVLFALEVTSVALALEQSFTIISNSPTRLLGPLIIVSSTVAAIYFTQTQTSKWRPLSGQHLEQQLRGVERIITRLSRTYSNSQAKDIPSYEHSRRRFGVASGAIFLIFFSGHLGVAFASGSGDANPFFAALFIGYFDALLVVSSTYWVILSANTPTSGTLLRLASSLGVVFLIITALLSYAGYESAESTKGQLVALTLTLATAVTQLGYIIAVFGSTMRKKWALVGIFAYNFSVRANLREIDRFKYKTPRT